MNPFSAFSFGKIIKTFIPGLIATFALLFWAELLHLLQEQISSAPQDMALWRLILSKSFFYQRLFNSTTSQSATLIGAILVPLALTLGFFLNTLHWVCFHNPCRKFFERGLAENTKTSRKKIESLARRAYRRTFPGHVVDREIPDVAIESFALAYIDLGKYTYLRESYFAWYEFQMNSFTAVSLTLLSYVATFLILSARWGFDIWRIVGYALIPLVLTGLVLWLLWKAAEENLVQYQSRMLWFIIGSIYFAKAES